MAERGLQERRERLLAHLAGGHRELAVLGLAEPADVAIDRHVVGRIGEDRVDPGALEQGGVDAGVLGIAADQPMPLQLPDVARPRDGDGRRLDDLVLGRIQGIGRGLAGFVDDDVDLADREAGQIEVVLGLDQALQLDREELLVPAGVRARACCRRGCRRVFRSPTGA